MKVLLVNRYLYRRGGDATYTIALARLLQERGHEVICFGLRTPQNDPSLNVPVAVDPIDFPALLDRGGITSAIEVMRRTVYSYESKAKMEAVLDTERPDIVHLQNIHHHLSPSVISAAAGRQTPVVWTMHDFSVICPNGNLFSNGRVCEECRPTRFHRVIINRCKRGSVPASLVAAMESTVHRVIGIFKGVSLFIAPSQFVASKLCDFGFFPERIVHLNHFISRDDGSSASTSRQSELEKGMSGYLLYAGRLVPEKGIVTLLKAASRWGKLRLKIAGDGPLRDTVRQACRRNQQIEFLGWVGERQLRSLHQDAMGAVVPSEWYEPFGFAVVESLAMGRPVIGSAIGAIPELVGQESRGFLFRPGDPDDLARAVRELASDPARAAEMGSEGLRFVRENLSSDAHYERLMGIYSRALQRRIEDAA